MLTHTAYLDQLRTLNASSLAWQETLAGFVVLRLVDAWLTDESSPVQPDVQGMLAVREAIAHLPEKSPIRVTLSAIADVVEQSVDAHIQAIAPQFLQYGLAVYAAGHWSLAEHTLAILLDYSRAAKDSSTTITTSTYLAAVLRHMGQLLAAEEVGTIAVREAYKINHRRSYLTARLAVAKTRITRGFLSEAAQIQRDVEVDVRTYDLTDVGYGLVQDKMMLAMELKDYHAARSFGEQALDQAPNVFLVNRARSDLGAALIHLGEYQKANALELQALHESPEIVIQQSSLVNLLESAIRSRDQQAFQIYDKELANSSLPVSLQVHYRLLAGTGHRTFGNIDIAVQAAQEALAIATTYGITSVQKEAQVELQLLGHQPLGGTNDLARRYKL